MVLDKEFSSLFPQGQFSSLAVALGHDGCEKTLESSTAPGHAKSLSSSNNFPSAFSAAGQRRDIAAPGY